MPDQITPIRKWWIKWTNWEFWPFSLVYFPVGFYYTWLAIRNGSFFFFSASNPLIEFGGMRGEKKSDIYQLIPKKYLPKTKLFQKNEKSEARRYASQLGFPFIVKPDIGERGTWVEKIENEHDLSRYMDLCPVPYLIQELIEYPLELGVFYIRYPGEKNGKITSIVQKAFLKVIGDGQSSVKELLQRDPRASIQVNMEHDRIKHILDFIPENGQSVEIESIGNHCRGTMFLDKTDSVTPELTKAFDQLADEIPEFYFGRFDIRCTSLEELATLQDFKILELNGAGAEPGHIYQPGFSLFKAWRVINWHLAVLAEISHQNKKRGHPYLSFREGLKKLREVQKYNQILNNS
ncbi:MAG: hypothetical protein ACFHWX_19855 [Bacteroidota bacterium]